MKTASLSAALSLARPCLGSANPVLPILSHFCFEDDTLYAYDDTVATMIDLKSGLKDCALHGDTLASLLAVAGADKVEFKQSEGVVQMKAGGGWVKLPSLSVEKLGQFTIPEDTPDLSIPISAEVIAGLQAVLVSVGEDSKNPEFAGVTFELSGGALTLYSTNNHTASRYVAEKQHASAKKSVAAVLPSRACEQMLRLAASVKGEKDEPVEGKLWLNDRMALAEFGNVRMFSKVMQPNVKVLAEIFKTHADGGNYVKIPEEIVGEVTKACVLLGGDSVKHATFKFSKSEVSLSANGSLGEMQASVGCKSKLAGEVIIDPTFVQRVLLQTGEWRVNDGASLAFSGGKFSYVISSAPTKKR